MTKSSAVFINQTLHGYDNGHSLIASSIELQSDVRRKMLSISDMSGNNRVEGFDEYITAYPLKEINCFAIAKTWYANEMERPGCVWTHSLLISFSELPFLVETGFILRLFRRPKGLVDSQWYASKLESKVKSFDSQEMSPNFPPELIKNIIEKLYGQPDKAIAIKSISSRDFDSLFLNFWLQQSPRLKRNFTLCTGAIEPRKLDGRFLDLQVLPYRPTRESEALFVIDKSNSISEEIESSSEKWVNLIYEDLKKPTLLRSFLVTFGADVPGNRQSFKSLAECFGFFRNNRPNLQDSINLVASHFRLPADAAILKFSLLDPVKDNKTYFLPKYNEQEILALLATTSLYESLDYSKIQFERRFIDYLFSNRSDSLHLLDAILERDLNQFGENIFKMIADEKNEEATRTILYGQSINVTKILVSLNPKLSYSSNFWKAHIHNDLEIIQTLKRAGQGKVNWQKVISVLLESQIDVDPRIFEDDQINTISIILDWISLNNDLAISPIWTDYLERNPSKVLFWLRNNTYRSERSLLFVLNFLDPNSNDVLAEGAEPWLSVIELFANFESRHLSIRLAIFCLSLAFNFQGEASLKLFSFSLEIVYGQLKANQIPFRFWRFVEVHTKPLSVFQDWDKCKKLVIAVVDHAVRCHLNIDDLILTVKDDGLRFRILKRYNRLH